MRQRYFRALHTLPEGREVSVMPAQKRTGLLISPNREVFVEARLFGNPKEKRIAVFLSGAGCDSGYFHHQIAHLLSKGMTSLAINLRGMGTSTLGNTQPKEYVACCVNDVRRVIEQNKLVDRELHLVGHNLGVEVAVMFAHCSGRQIDIRSLIAISPVLEDPARTFPRDALTRSAGTLLLGTITGMEQDEEIERKVRTVLWIAGKASALKLLGMPTRVRRVNSEFWDSLSDINPRTILTAIQGMVHAGSRVEKIFARLRIPILVIGGQHDTLVRPDIGNRAKAINEGVEALTLGGVSHFAHLENPSVVNVLIELFSQSRLA